MKYPKKYLYIIIAVIILSAAIFFLSKNNSKLHNFYLRCGKYDAYVNGSNQAEGDGTKSNPFRTIGQAIESVKNKDISHKRIFVFSGEYKEKIVLEDNIFLYGEDMETTIIKGDKPYSDDISLIPSNSHFPAVDMKNNTVLDNFTVERGAPGITTESNVTIQNCLIKNAQVQGIDALPGQYSIKISDVEVTGTAGKAIYIQKGRTIALNNIASHHNLGEGIDLRENLAGKVTNSRVYANGEAGIEFIAGDTAIFIENNLLIGNAQDGIQAQFCSGASCDNTDSMKIGKTIIANNTIKYNGEWGIRCNIPSGIPEGSPYADDFWKNSIQLKNNSFEGNRKTYDSRCKF